MKNKIKEKLFLGAKVRVVNDEYIVLRDMFEVLGRVREDGTWTNEKRKLLNFLEDINKIDHHQKIRVVSKQGKHKSEREFDVLHLDVCPVVLTQFKPSERKDGSNKEQVEAWKKFMIFVDDLLTSLQVKDFICQDIGLQKEKMSYIQTLGGSPMQINIQTNIIMAKLIGIHPDIGTIKKEELRIYQDKTTIDLFGCQRVCNGKID